MSARGKNRNQLVYLGNSPVFPAAFDQKLIQQNAEDENHAKGADLPDGVNAAEIQTVVDHGDNGDTQKSSDWFKMKKLSGKRIVTDRSGAISIVLRAHASKPMNRDGASVLLKPIICVDPVILFSTVTFLLTSFYFIFNC